MARLADRLRELSPDAQRLGVEAGTLIPSSKGASVDPGGWVVVVDGEGAARLLHELGEEDGLAGQLAMSVAISEPERLTWPVYVAVEPGTPAAAVAGALADVTAAGLRGDARLLVAANAPASDASDRALLAVPGVDALRRRLAEAGSDGAERAVALAAALEKAIMPCAPIVKLFGAMAMVSVSEKMELVAQVPGAARECRCKLADLDVFEFAMLSVLGAFERQVKWVPVPPVTAADRRTMADVVPE